MIVVGCGRVGSELALNLVEMGFETVIMDKSPAAFRRLPREWGGQTLVGFGFDQDHLRQAGIDHCHALAAVTSGDNSTSSRPGSPASATRSPTSWPASTTPDGPRSTGASA